MNISSQNSSINGNIVMIQSLGLNSKNNSIKKKKKIRRLLN